MNKIWSIIILSLSMVGCFQITIEEAPCDHDETIVIVEGTGGASSTASSSVSDASSSTGDNVFGCLCEPDTEIGVDNIRACGSTVCYDNLVWSCGASGWIKHTIDCELSK